MQFKHQVEAFFKKSLWRDKCTYYYFFFPIEHLFWQIFSKTFPSISPVTMSMDYKVWIVVWTRNSLSACDLFQEHLKTCLPKHRVLLLEELSTWEAARVFKFYGIFNLFLNYILCVLSLLAVNKRGCTK